VNGRSARATAQPTVTMTTPIPPMKSQSKRVTLKNWTVVLRPGPRNTLKGDHFGDVDDDVVVEPVDVEADDVRDSGAEVYAGGPAVRGRMSC
jgi:hypothetical protein